MKKLYYKVYFYATKSGCSEKRKLVPVFMPRFDEFTGKHITQEQQKQRGESALKGEGFYDIEYGSTIATELIFG